MRINFYWKDAMKSKKEMTSEYKQMKFKIGVFQIRNLVNGKIFIGSAMNLDAKWNSQKMQLQSGTHTNEELLKDWKEFGAENFVYEILEEIKQNDDDINKDYRNELKELEAFIFEDLQPYNDKGYHKKKVHSL